MPRLRFSRISSLLACLLLATPPLAVAGGATVVPKPTGAMTIGGVAVDLVLQDNKLVRGSANVKVAEGFPKTEGATWTTQGTIQLGEALLTLEQTVKTNDDGSTELKVDVTSDKDINPQLSALVAKLPADKFAGASLAYNGGTPDLLPASPGGAIVQWKGGLTTIGVPALGDLGGFEFQGKLSSCVADHRTWGEPNFGLRLLFDRELQAGVKTFRHASFHTTIRPMAAAGAMAKPIGDKPVATVVATDKAPTLPDGTRLPTNLKAWALPQWNTYVSTPNESEDGTPCFRLATKQRDWHQFVTTRFFYPRDLGRVVFTGKIKTDRVSGGVAPEEAARAQLSFLTTDGERTGGWPSATVRTGSHEWESFRQEHEPKKDARVVEVSIGMYLSIGTAWYDDLQVAAYDMSGQPMMPLPATGKIVTDTTGWHAFEPGTEDVSRPMVIDFSPLISGNAGSRGFVTAADGVLRFTDGSRARFWGVGSDPARKSKAEIEQRAKGWPRFGINLVRYHNISSYTKGSLWDESSGTTTKFDAAKLDLFDYQIAQNKAAGIYADLNLNSYRQFTDADGVRDAKKLTPGGGVAVFFNRRLIDLQKEFARDLMNHVNPYTGLAYKDEPAIAMLELKNETTFGSIEFMGGVPQSYLDELQDLFKAWCHRNSRAEPAENFTTLIRKRDEAACQFAYEVTRDYGKEIADYLKNEVGVKIPITNTNLSGSVGDLLAHAELDFVDRHSYWDHPTGGWGPTGSNVNRPMVRLDERRTMMESFAANRVQGRPLTISEWNFIWPNEYVAEGPLLMSAFAGFQDWDAPMVFCIGSSWWGEKMDGLFANENKPHMMAAMLPAAIMYLRGDVAPGPALVRPVSRRDVTRGVGELFSREELLTKRVALQVQTAATDSMQQQTTTGASPVSLDPQTLSKPEAKKSDAPAALYASTDGQIRWYSDGLFLLNAPRAQAMVGFSRGQPQATADVKFDISTNFAEVSVLSLDDKPIQQASRVLISSSARAENSGQSYHEFRRGLKDVGTGPILLEPVKGTVSVRRDAGVPTPTAFVVDWYGRRTTQTLPVTNVDGQWRVDLTACPTAWIELSFTN